MSLLMHVLWRQERSWASLWSCVFIGFTDFLLASRISLLWDLAFLLSGFVVCFHCMPVPPCSVPNNVCPLWKPTGPWQEGSWWPVVSLSGSLASQCLLLPPYRRGSPCSDWFQMKWVLAWVCWFPSLPGLASGGAGTAKPYVWQFRSRCGVHVCQI